MAPRISPRFPPRARSSYEVFRDNPEHALPEQRAFWRWALAAPFEGGDGERPFF